MKDLAHFEKDKPYNWHMSDKPYNMAQHGIWMAQEIKEKHLVTISWDQSPPVACFEVAMNWKWIHLDQREIQMELKREPYDWLTLEIK